MVPADLILTAFEDVQRTLDTPDAARLVASVKAVVPEFLKTGGEARRPVAENTT
jgi:hypothetical protein